MLTVSVQGPGGRSPLSRRAMLGATLQSAGALGLTSLMSPGTRAAERGGERPALIQLWLGGGPSHLDMYDLKPAAPEANRGPFRPIATDVPGVQICELLPLQARAMHRLAIVRSLHHGTDDHAAGMHWVQTGHPATSLGTDSLNPSHPSLGSVVAHERGANRAGFVPYVHIAPDPMGYPIFPRIFDASFLGAAYDPLRVEYLRKKVDPMRVELDNLIGRPEFLAPALDLAPEMSLARFDDRDRLRKSLDDLRRMGQSAALERLDVQQRQAVQLVSQGARSAFDLTEESDALRDRYGRNAWGQGLLLCRRLVEAGATAVTLNTDTFSGQWDTHVHAEHTFREMLPLYDQMLTALLDDLCERGLYDRVLVLVWGEFGRTPNVNAAGGRDHWGRAAFALLGGAGIQGGAVLGSTTARGEEPRERPVTPADVLATVYRILGIDPEATMTDATGRPIKVLAEGETIRELLA